MTSPGKNILIRKATLEDVPFVAECVLASVDLYDFVHPSIEKDIAELVCSQEDTLYSYTNADIAVVDGVPAGCLISYDGAFYTEARPRTFAFFRQAGRGMDDSEPETGPGEYYLDSLAIKPEFRNDRLGLLLMNHAVEEASKRGFTRFTLIVRDDEPQLQQYYSALGFRVESKLFAFRESYLKMSLLCQ